jgi:hypothetical protein
VTAKKRAAAEDKPAQEQALPLMAEGVRQELELRGKAHDPFTGGTFHRDEQGNITYTPRKS